MSLAMTTTYKKIGLQRKRIRVNQGGTSSGKTFAILLHLLDYATRHPNKLITVAAVNYPHLRRGAMRDFKNILNEGPYWAYYRIDYNKAESTFKFFNGSVIEFVALNEYTARGSRRDVLFINEANLVTFETFQQLEVRTKDFAIIDFNPTSEFWAHEELVGVRDDVDFIITTYLDNEALDDQIINSIEMRKSNTNWWRVYGMGEIGELEGLVYSGWEMIDEVPEEAELQGYGLDFGYTNDPTAIVAVYKHDGGFILDELCYKTGLFNDDIAEIIKGHSLESLMGVGDSSEPKSIDEIARHGITIKGAQKKSGEPAKSYNQWAISKIQELKISYTANSHNLRKEYLGYMWATDRTGKSLNIPEDGTDHILDAVKYKLIDLLYAPKVEYAGIL
jgi:phage terminase large subunit